MSRVCDLCGKTYQKGHNISHSAKKSIKRNQPNLRTVRVEVGGGMKKMKLCAQCLKKTKMVEK